MQRRPRTFASHHFVRLVRRQRVRARRTAASSPISNDWRRCTHRAISTMRSTKPQSNVCSAARGDHPRQDCLRGALPRGARRRHLDRRQPVRLDRRHPDPIAL